MFKEMVGLADAGKFEFVLDRRLQPTGPKEERKVLLHRKSPVCDNCWRELWFQMIFTYFKDNFFMLPESLKNRPFCYWGVNCHTMMHNVEHAKKYNHMEFQSKFA
jgi:hypothetical protein